MSKAKKLPSGNWRCRATITDSDGNKVTQSFTAETPKKAEALAKMWQAGMIEQKRQRETGGITLGEALDMEKKQKEIDRRMDDNVNIIISLTRKLPRILKNIVSIGFIVIPI